MSESDSFLEYIRAGSKASEDASDIKIAIVTNFTDDILQKLLRGMCAKHGIRASIFAVPFKQYHFMLKDTKSPLYEFGADITYVFFDSNPYIESELLVAAHAEAVADDLIAYARSGRLTVVQTIPSNTSRQHSRLLASDVSSGSSVFNQRLREYAAGTNAMHVLDTDMLARRLGERQTRDLRGLYAFSQPFSHAFLLLVAEEWFSFVRVRRGLIRKCIVVDLDNTLWGGIVGETGPLGIALGHEYPGNAYRMFQRMLLQFFERGIILAINSRNNETDVDEVFAKNPHMILRPEHVAARRINWLSKADNLSELAEELNIGLDSLVFIDDDPVNRALVRSQLPEVLVPEWTMPPEEYTHALLELDAFHALRITDEDRRRGEMYAAENKRKAAAHEAQSPEAYLASLGIALDISVNKTTLMPRVSQLTQKTNQYNLTTIRTSEGELAELIENGALVYAADVRDSFGSYGVTAIAIVTKRKAHEADLHTFLMSCRVAGRHVEDAFFAAVCADIEQRGFKKLHTRFISSAKNAPVKEFLPTMGATETRREDGREILYEISLGKHLQKTPLPLTVTMVS